MVSNYFTLSALVNEWRPLLVGGRLDDAYSHLPGELTIVFGDGNDRDHDGDDVGLRISTRPGRSFVFSVSNPKRPRSNVTSLLSSATDRTVRDVSIAEGDRIVTIWFEDGDRLEIHPYGSRSNVLLVSDGLVVDAFKRADSVIGKPPPSARQADLPEGADYLAARMESFDGPPAKRLKRAIPMLTPGLAEEALELGDGNPWDGLRLLRTALSNPTAVVYETDGGILLSLIELTHLEADPAERFASVNEAVRWTVGRRSSRERLKDARADLAKALERSKANWAKRVEEIGRALASESRADRYETWGHLLMAHPNAERVRGNEDGAAGRAADDSVTVANIMDDGSLVTIGLKADRTIVENAQRYYERARKLREEREHLGGRLRDAQRSLEVVGRLAEELASVTSARDAEAFKKRYESELRQFVGGRTSDVESAPFRRYTVTGGYEVWVGRNARENDKLTFGAAARHDLWFHARGVPGSHVVLRVPGRLEKVPRPVIEEAAAIAALS